MGYPDRVDAAPTAVAFLPAKLTLRSLREAAASCRGCDLYRAATQTVFGEGRARARIMLVGEQPGDAEDRAGLPFVGPPASCCTRRSSRPASIRTTRT